MTDTTRTWTALEGKNLNVALASKPKNKDEMFVIGAVDIRADGTFDRTPLAENREFPHSLIVQFAVSAAEHIKFGDIEDDNGEPNTYVNDRLLKRAESVTLNKDGKVTVAAATKALATPIGTKGNSVAAEYFRTIQDNRNFVSKQTKAAKTVAKASKGATAPNMDDMMAQMEAQLMQKVMAGFMAKFLGNDES